MIRRLEQYAPRIKRLEENDVHGSLRRDLNLRIELPTSAPRQGDRKGRTPCRSPVARRPEKDRGARTGGAGLRGVDVRDSLVDVRRAGVRGDRGFPVGAPAGEGLLCVKQRCRRRRVRDESRGRRKRDDRDDECDSREKDRFRVSPPGPRERRIGISRFGQLVFKSRVGLANPSRDRSNALRIDPVRSPRGEEAHERRSQDDGEQGDENVIRSHPPTLPHPGIACSETILRWGRF